MKNASIRLAIYSVLIFSGVVLMLCGITWMLFSGLAMFSLASFFSSDQRPDRRGRIGALLFYAACSAVFFCWDYRDGVAFIQKTRPVWLWLAFGGVGLWCIGREFYWWLISRRLT